MKKEEVEYYLNKLPIKIRCEDRTVITVKSIIELLPNSISVIDRDNCKWTIDLSNITSIQELNSTSKTANGGGSLW